MAILPSKYKIPCPFCNGDIIVPQEQLGQLSTCPHCSEEITLDRPTNDSALKTTGAANRFNAQQIYHGKSLSSVPQGVIVASYLLSLFIPIVGLILAIYLIIKNEVAHGVLCLILNLLIGALFVAML